MARGSRGKITAWQMQHCSKTSNLSEDPLQVFSDLFNRDYLKFSEAD
jgi:hypothetical protein